MNLMSLLECPQGQTLVGQDCRAVSTTLGGKCTTDGDCQIPSSFCNAGKCDCIPGAAKSGSSCSLSIYGQKCFHWLFVHIYNLLFNQLVLMVDNLLKLAA